MTAFQRVSLGEVATPVARDVTPIPGETYRQLGVRLWGQGVYEREPIDGGATKYAQLFRAEEGDIVVPAAIAGRFRSSRHGRRERRQFSGLAARHP
jgi:hypothetical protein